MEAAREKHRRSWALDGRGVEDARGGSRVRSPTAPQPRSSSSPTSGMVKVSTLLAQPTCCVAAAQCSRSPPIAQGRLHPRPREAATSPHGPKPGSYSGPTPVPGACPTKGLFDISAAFGLQDYNPHGLALMLVYKHGSTHGGIDGYGCPELSWLGLVASDVLEPLPRSLFTGSRADAERTLPSM